MEGCLSAQGHVSHLPISPGCQPSPPTVEDHRLLVAPVKCLPVDDPRLGRDFEMSQSGAGVRRIRTAVLDMKDRLLRCCIA
jgi:hypothetical protein